MPRQRVRRCEQRHMYRLQSGHVLSSGNGHAVALPCRLLLSTDHWCDECTASAVPHWIILQCHWVGCRRALSSGLDVSDSRPVFSAASVPDRICVSEIGLVGGCAVPARSILPRDGTGSGCFVSSRLVQPVAGHERLDGLHTVCIGVDGVAGSVRVHRDLSCRLVRECDGKAVRDVSRWDVLPRFCQSGPSLSCRYA
jgi:hypothetical protein